MERILKNMTEVERAKIADVLREKSFFAGEKIIKQGEPGDNFYIVYDGKAKATLDSDKDVSIKDYAPSNYFGELALLHNKPRAANVIAVSDCKMLLLDRASFQRLLGPLE